MAVSTTQRRPLAASTESEEAPVAKTRTWPSQHNEPVSEDKTSYEIPESVPL